MSPRRADPPTLEFVILGLVRLQPTHGYDLLQTLHQDAGIGLIWQTKPGKLYALLDKLEDAGWLQQETKTGEGFLPRKEYRLTPAGEDAFRAWLLSPVTAPHRMRQEFLARIFFAAHEDKQVLEQIIARQRQMCQRWRDNQQQAYEKLTPEQNYERLVYDFRIGQIDAMLRWLDGSRN